MNDKRKKPVKNVPIILPSVEIAYKFPTVFPEVCKEVILNFAAYGGIIPKITLGREKIETAEINVPSTMPLNCKKINRKISLENK